MLGSFNYQYIITATGRQQQTVDRPTDRPTNQPTNRPNGSTLICIGVPYFDYIYIYIYEFTCAIINMKNMCNGMNGRAHICYSFACFTQWIASTNALIHTIYSQFFFFCSLVCRSSSSSSSFFPSIAFCGTNFATIWNMSINKLCFPFRIYSIKTENSRFFQFSRLCA